jgi:hypothetical protein
MYPSTGRRTIHRRLPLARRLLAAVLSPAAVPSLAADRHIPPDSQNHAGVLRTATFDGRALDVNNPFF